MVRHCTQLPKARLTLTGGQQFLLFLLLELVYLLDCGLVEVGGSKLISARYHPADGLVGLLADKVATAAD